MWPLLTGLISGGASLLGNVFSANTSAQNTQAQIAGQQAMQTQSEQFNAQQSEVNRQFQEQMSSTAYQRSRQDMIAAGLNPILAAGAGGASTPSGSTASVGTPTMPTPQRQSPFAGLGDVVTKAVTSAIAAKTYDKMTDEIANLQAQQAKIGAETSRTRQETKTEEAETERRQISAVVAAKGLPAAELGRQEAKQALAMPEWLRQLMVQGAYSGGKIGSTISPLTDLVSGAKGVRSLFPRAGSRSGSSTTSEDAYGSRTRTFNERWSE